MTKWKVVSQKHASKKRGRQRPDAHVDQTTRPLLYTERSVEYDFLVQRFSQSRRCAHPPHMGDYKETATRVDDSSSRPPIDVCKKGLDILRHESG